MNSLLVAYGDYHFQGDNQLVVYKINQTLQNLELGPLPRLNEKLRLALVAADPRDDRRVEGILRIDDDEKLLIEDLKITAVPSRSELNLVVGATRPESAMRIVQWGVHMGITAIYFCKTELCEESYLKSSKLSEDKLERILAQHLSQVWDTRAPNVEILELNQVLTEIKDKQENFCYLDLSNNHYIENHGFVKWLFIGPERGWSSSELESFANYQNGSPLRLGERIYCVDTAAIYASTKMLNLRS